MGCGHWPFTGIVKSGQNNSDGNCPGPPLLFCPDFTMPVNGQCPQPINPGCQKPKVLSDGECVCPANTEGNDCHKSSKCDAGQHMEDNECVPNKARKKKPKRKKPSESATQPSQSAPPVELNIGIGIGGGGRGGGHRGTTPRMPRGPSG